MLVTNIKFHPQLNHIKYNPQDNQYQMWDKEGNYFHFYVIPFEDYILDVINKTKQKGDNMNNNTKQTFRLYINRGSGYEHIMNKPDVAYLIPTIEANLPEENILNTFCSVLIIQNINNGDVSYWLGYNKKDLLKLKQSINYDNQTNISFNNKIKVKRKEG